MGDEPIHLRDTDLCTVRNLARDIGQDPNRKFEHRLSIHAQEWIARNRATRDLSWHTQNIRLRPVGMQCACQ